MKERTQGIVIGAAMAAVIFAAPALAASIDAQFNTVNVQVNGQMSMEKGQNYTREDGKEMPSSINYDGTVYLPLRQLGDLLGQQVGWNGETGTVVIGEQSGTETEPETPASKLTGIVDGLIEQFPASPYMRLETDAMQQLYGVDPALLEDFSVAVPGMNIRVNEIALMQVKDAKDLETVENALKQRQASVVGVFEHYLVDQLEIAQNAKIGHVGNVAYLIIHEQADEMETALQAALA